MKIVELLNEAYENIKEKEEAVQYALKYLSYVDEGNEVLKTPKVLRYQETREKQLTGEEMLENGYYVLWSVRSQGSEILMWHKTKEDALVKKEQIENTFFNENDACFLKEVK